MEINKYIENKFNPLHTSDKNLLTQYETLKGAARSVIRVAIKYPEDKDLLENVAKLEKQATQLHVTALNPVLGECYSMIQNNRTLAESMSDILAVNKLHKMLKNYGDSKQTKKEGGFYGKNQVQG
ncbi:hypothetical protein FDP41_004847 [Naegleria fowleri]|uniref:Uncharacterized protein n=1 Tax=Naegleria fowleri TaxID=5763 RepID=A0A6A5BMR4_NAEFO|nr:uncharacterized protein FDP41_004847 [Naegleria fowleri]KAF0976172.1 hypothetical protein FDP41_004847 [Naegleria fowleri]